jgi:hypothetical protein
MTAQPRHPRPRDTAPMLRNLRRVGIIAVLAAIAIMAFGILQHHSHKAEVVQWTRKQAVLTVANY